MSNFCVFKASLKFVYTTFSRKLESQHFNTFFKIITACIAMQMNAMPCPVVEC